MAMVGELAASQPVTLTFTATVCEAARVMRDEAVGDVIVVDHAGRAVGMLTARDVAVRLVAGGLDGHTTTAGQICSNPLATVQADDHIERARRIMATEKISRLPVIDGAGMPIGIVSLTQLAASSHIGDADLRGVVRSLAG